VRYAPPATGRGPWRVAVAYDGERVRVCPDCQARASARGFYGLFRDWQEPFAADAGRSCDGGCTEPCPEPGR
jgi:hypothetical protein